MNEEKIRINLGSGGKTFKKYFWSDRKGKIIAALLIIVVILFALQVFAKVPVSTMVQEPVYYIFGFTQEFYVEGDGNPEVAGGNLVVFPYSILACQHDTSCEYIFSSVDVIEVVFLKDNGDWSSWKPTRVHNTLETIEPYKTYYVIVNQDCTFTLKCPD